MRVKNDMNKAYDKMKWNLYNFTSHGFLKIQ